MARIRTIKPDFWTDEKLTECSLSARLFFVGTWNFADDNGNLQRSPKKLKMQIFPADTVDCEPLIQELMAQGILMEYEANGEKFLHIKTFARHQVINRPSKSRIPQPQIIADSRSTHGAVIDGREEEGKGREVKEEANASVDSGTNAPTDDLLAEQGFGKVTPPSGESKSVATHCPADRIVKAYHELMPDNPRVKVLNDARRGMIAARWREAAKLTCKPFGYASTEQGLQAWRSFFEVCADSEFLTGKSNALPGKPPFIADIDFLMSPKGFAKVLENKYHREAVPA